MRKTEVPRSVLARAAALGLGALLATTASASATEVPVLFEQPLSPRIANYALDARLDVDRRMLEVEEVLVWVNKTGQPLEELQFHLYLNAFRNTKSTFIQESSGKMRGSKLDEDGWGFSEIDSITLVPTDSLDPAELARYVSPIPSDEGLRAAASPGSEEDSEGAETESTEGGAELAFPLNSAEVDLSAAMEFIRPDDGNEDDFTVFRLPLPEPLPAGAAIAIRFDYHAQLPTPPFARTGTKGDYYFVGQWFPKIGVFWKGDWNCHQFHLHSEFFADYGVYDVRMTVPSDHVLGATGTEVERVDNGDGTTTHWYHAEDVHDFAWTSSPHFVVFEGQAQDVALRVLMQPDHAEQGERHVAAGVVSVSSFQDRWGDYPFPNLTIVDPPGNAMGSGGMEYPTLITAGTVHRLPAGVRLPELVIIHEFGHNYWYHLLASNEFEESWLDEGINTYTEGRIIADTYGNAIDWGPVEIPPVAMNRASYLRRPDSDPVVTRAWEFYDSESYGANSYARPGTLLETLRAFVGPETMEEIIHTYVARWRFRHPTTTDFIAVAEEVAGQDLSWFFDQALYSTAVLDYSVSFLENKEMKALGYGIRRAVDDPWIDPETPFDPAAEDSKDEEDAEKIYESTVKVRRLGDFRFPVELRVVFDDDTVVEETWDGQDRWKTFRWEGPRKVVSATVDPDRKVVLDANLVNNSRVDEPCKLGLHKLTLHWTFLGQLLADFFSL